jgi:hypothetical protein
VVHLHFAPCASRAIRVAARGANSSRGDDQPVVNSVTNTKKQGFALQILRLAARTNGDLELARELLGECCSSADFLNIDLALSPILSALEGALSAAG